MAQNRRTKKNPKIKLKMTSDLHPEFSPNSFPRRHFSDLGPKGAKRGPKGAKREPKGTKRNPKRNKEHKKNTKNYTKLYETPEKKL